METGPMIEHRPVMIDLDECRPEYQRSTQSPSVGGISFSPLSLLQRRAILAGVAVIGTIPLPVEGLDLLSTGMEVTFVFPSSSDLNAEDEYSRIREEIVASGLPLLGDDEVRAEIRDRRGVRDDNEA
jgi:hypothetical protein